MSPEFSYQARSREGQSFEGSTQASSRAEVARQLREEGYFVTRVEESTAGSRSGFFSMDVDLDNIKFWDQGFKIADLARFSQQLAVLIKAGIPLVEALEIMERQVQKEHVRDMLGEVIGSVEAGETFSQALQKHPDYFPPLFVHLIRAGETGGVLDSVLNQLVEYYKRRDKINKEVKAALYYPVVIVIVAIVAVFILTTFVLPVLLDMLLQFGGELPLPTRILVGVSDFMSSYWWAVAAVMILGFMLFRSYIKTPNGKRAFDRFILKIPVVGDLIMKIVISRFASTLALLIRSGVNIISALPVLEDVVGNEVYAEILAEARGRVREGVSLSQPIQDSGEFPPIVVQMLKVGEETGNMEEMLNRLSEYYDIEVENAIEGGISLIEPFMIIVMAVVVGGIIISIILPLFDIYHQI